MFTRKPVEKSPYGEGRPSGSVIGDVGLGNYRSKVKADWLLGVPDYLDSVSMGEVPTVVAVGGGKGGVGKSLISSNLAAKLGEQNKRVLLVDLDLGSANLHTYFGVSGHSPSLHEYIKNPNLSLESVVVQTSAINVSLVCGGQNDGSAEATHYSHSDLQRMWEAFARTKNTLGIDIIVLDLGAGTHRQTIDFFTCAHMGIVSVLPEPTSIENAYSFLKVLMWQLVESTYMRSNQSADLKKIQAVLFSNAGNNLPKSYTARLNHLSKEYPDLLNHIARCFKGRKLGFIVNQIRNHKDTEVGPSMQGICRNYFGYQTLSLGYLNYDEAAWKSLRNRRLLVRDFGYTPIVKRIHEISTTIINELSSF